MLRREVRTCKPAHFAEFVLHWQRCHPTARQGEQEGLVLALERLEGLALPWQVWESAVLPARVPGFQRRWLEELINAGEWTWFFEADREDSAGLVTFCTRAELAQRPPPQLAAPVTLSAQAEVVLECLKRRGASFSDEITRETELATGAVRQSLWDLLRAQLVSNDRLEVLHEDQLSRGMSTASTVVERRSALVLRRRRESLRPPEGRWFVLSWGRPDSETQAIDQATLLLDRYGVAARELALLDQTMLPWRILYEVLSRMELAGDVRRGYFVEGMSGAQFALPEAIRMMQDLEPASTAAHSSVLLHSLDPANLYGSGAPFDVRLLDGGTRSWTRRAGSWLVVRAGRPVLFIEQRGKRLTAPAGIPLTEVEEALQHLSAAGKSRIFSSWARTADRANLERTNRDADRNYGHFGKNRLCPGLSTDDLLRRLERGRRTE